MSDISRIKSRLKFLYPEEHDDVYRRLQDILARYDFEDVSAGNKEIFSEKDAILICYADHVKAEGNVPLRTMKRFLDRFCSDIISKVHILPFFPYSSDDGFSVIDYREVNPDFGDWRDVESIGECFGLMFDLVINHVSSKSRWFKGFLDGEKPYKDYFISFDEHVDTSKVFRPRTHPLLTEFETAEGKRLLWTTFSADQIDLDFSNPDVLLEMIDVLLFYLEKGADTIRLDAIAFLWKKLGTSCMHLEETHEVVKLFRDVIEHIAPGRWIITETNVPHKDNVSYFGDGDDEAHLVYNFTLPPLLLYTLLKEDASLLSRWADSLELPSNKTTFFNFTASHDGIGLTPLKDIVPDDEIIELAEDVKEKGGRVNYRDVPGKDPFPYELNAVYMDALGSDPERFMLSQAIQLSLKGVPGIYMNSIIGAENWQEGVEKLGYNRAINRQKFDYNELAENLGDDTSKKGKVYKAYARLLDARRNEPSFSPLADQKIIDMGKKLFAVLRGSGDDAIICIHNVALEDCPLNHEKILSTLGAADAVDLLTGEKMPERLGKNSFVWLKQGKN